MRRFSPSSEAADAVAASSSRRRVSASQVECGAEAAQENWDWTRQMWEAALRRARAAILDCHPKGVRGVQCEYGKLDVFTANPSLAKEQVEDLALEISANASCATGEISWLRLSSALSLFAAKC